MSENYGPCRHCAGKGRRKDPVLHTEKECGTCGGTGLSGDARDYQREQEKLERIGREWEADYGYDKKY